MPVVTLSGTMGSGAREVGLRVAELLGSDYVDQQIMVDAARRLGVSTETVAERDERCPSFRERLAHMLRTFLERSAVAGAGDPLMGSGGLEMLLGRTYTDLGTDSAPAGFDKFQPERFQLRALYDLRFHVHQIGRLAQNHDQRGEGRLRRSDEREPAARQVAASNGIEVGLRRHS